MKPMPLLPRDQISEMAIAILRTTRDGNMLAPQHLKLVELAVNNRLDESGFALFQALYDNATKREGYTVPFLFGIEHLTIDQHGVVRWRSTAVEHFDHAVWRTPGWRQRMRAAAEEVASRCRALEAKGLQPTARLLLHSD